MKRTLAAVRKAYDVDVTLTAYQLTVFSFRLPVAIHYVVNAFGFLSMAMIGHPWFGLALFISASLFDTYLQATVRRRLRAPPPADEARGMRAIGRLCAARTLAYTWPALVMAVRGGAPELAIYFLQAGALMAVAMGASALSLAAFYGFALALAVETAALFVLRFPPLLAAGVLLPLTTLTGLTVLIAGGANRTIADWHAAFLSSIAMGGELATARDQAVAERAAADAARVAAREANRAKSNFLAAMSHEIRTPMNGVLGMAQLMKREETQPAQAERLDILIESGEHLLSILNDILDVSKIDAGKLEITPAPEAMRPFLRRLIAFWSGRAAESGVALSLEIAEGVPDTVMVDGLRLRQVMFNLVGNALKFTEAGSVEVLADARPLAGGAVSLHLTVRDTGPGIPDSSLPRLFERFSQVDGSEARRFGGAGLGLAIVKQLVELMDGRVWVESVLGQGSAFHVELPLQPVTSSEASAPQATASEAWEPGGLRILAVDDNAVNLLVLDQLLTSLGHQVSKAASGAEALEALADEAFDLVLMDIQMPVMSGIEALQRLRAQDGPNRCVPVIALTADVTSGGRGRYLDAGFAEHAAKPIQLPELLAAISRAVGDTAPDPAEAAPAANRVL